MFGKCTGDRLSLREDQMDSGPGSPGGEEEREYKAWKKSLCLVLSQVSRKLLAKTSTVAHEISHI